MSGIVHAHHKKKISEKGINALEAYRKSGKKPPKKPKATGEAFHIENIGVIRIMDRPYTSKGNFFISGTTITYKPEGGAEVVVIDNGQRTSRMTEGRMGRLWKQGAVRK